ncbi:MAG TPA: hypothetical protein VGM25_14740 [Caulobacteraceae bacterium]
MRSASRLVPALVPGLVALTLAASASPAAAASFDGRWIADIPAQGGRCNMTSTMSLVVSGDAISGEVQNPGNRHPISGKLTADGTANFAVDHRWFGTMSFTGDRFEATWNNGACDRHASGDREADSSKKAALAAERKRRQDSYADLLAKAKAGDTSTDYRQLRAESVYAKDWDFYDQKARGLLDQANAAVKGKDCTSAMAQLDQVIRLDFTIDAAHSLKSDCLKQAGDRDGARIESGIAKGLIHSLMDSGRGDAEKNAYVVSSLREEMDVLANRHIQLKTRDTEIRGSDGRFYDVVHGISIRGSYGISIETRVVYFDVTSFVEGRASRRAAAEVLAAQLQ